MNCCLEFHLCTGVFASWQTKNKDKAKSLVLVFGAPGGTRVFARSTRVPRPFFFFTAHKVSPVLPNLYRNFCLVADKK